MHYLRHLKMSDKFEVKMEIKWQIPVLLIYDRLKIEEVIFVFWCQSLKTIASIQL